MFRKSGRSPPGLPDTFSTSGPSEHAGQFARQCATSGSALLVGMTRSYALGPTAALAAGLLAAACGGGPKTALQTAPEPATADVAALARARTDSARHPSTEADVYFMSGMIHHHAQAIVMSGWAPTHGASPSVRTLAERIINAQQDEIATMQQWLRDRGQPVPDARATGMKMTTNGMQHEMLMPGMLTQTQMQQLDAARDAEFDRLFL